MDHYTSRQLALLNNSLEVLGNTASLGFNIYKADFDLSFHEKSILTFDLKKTVRLGMASPIVNGSNVFAERKDFRRIGANIVHWAERLENNDILFGFDCGFVLCMFTEEQLGKLTRASLGFTSTCQPVIDIGANLDVWACFPLSKAITVRLEHYKSLEELRSMFESAFRPVKQFGIFDECIECKYMKRGQCRAGCLAYTIQDISDSGVADILGKLSRNATVHSGRADEQIK